MNIGGKFSNENKKAEINFENRKETRNMKNTTALFTVQKLYDICGEAEKGLEYTKINLDASLITKLEELEVTEENIQFVKQLICGKATAVYSEYEELKKKGRFSQPHVAIITLHIDDDDELATLSLNEKETENFDGIRFSATEYNSTEFSSTRSLFEMYYPDNVVIDGNTIIEYGMYKLPDKVNQLRISKLYMAENGKEGNVLLPEEAKPLFERPVYQVPLKEDVIRWVRTKSEDYISEQKDSEEGYRNIAMAQERFEKFVDTFNKRYNEERFVAAVLDYYRWVKEEPNNAILHHVLEMKIGHMAAELLLVIKEMTEYDLTDCFWKV